MNRRIVMAGKAYRAALQLRTKTHRAINLPLCPFDVAEEIGVEVRFADIASMEGMYVDDGTPKIILAADRPPGRQRFSCAHELGHHVFGHGTHISCVDFSLADRHGLPEEEYLAQSFAGLFLLPKATVSHAFSIRGWDPREAVPEQYYTIAGFLGVSFEGLVTHCERALKLLDRKQAASLRGVGLQLRGWPVNPSPATSWCWTRRASAQRPTSVDDRLLACAGAAPVNGALAVEAATRRPACCCGNAPRALRDSVRFKSHQSESCASRVPGTSGGRSSATWRIRTVSSRPLLIETTISLPRVDPRDHRLPDAAGRQRPEPLSRNSKFASGWPGFSRARVGRHLDAALAAKGVPTSSTTASLILPSIWDPARPRAETVRTIQAATPADSSNAGQSVRRVFPAPDRIWIGRAQRSQLDTSSRLTTVVTIARARSRPQSWIPHETTRINTCAGFPACSRCHSTRTSAPA